MASRKKLALLSAVAAACAPAVASAQLFTDDFNTAPGTARYTAYAVDNDTGAETAGALGESGGAIQPGAYDVNIQLNYDYGSYTYYYTNHLGDVDSTATIPLAPRSGLTDPLRGLRIDVNDVGGVGNTQTVSASLFPKLSEYAGSQLPSGSYKMTVDMWINYNGDELGDGGSTEFFSIGVNQTGTGVGGILGAAGQAGQSFSTNGEHGTGFDYRLYSGNALQSEFNFGLDQEVGYVAQDMGPGLPGPNAGENDFYHTGQNGNGPAFPFLNPSNANEAWYESDGAPGKHWTTWEVKYEDGIVYYYAKPAGAANSTLIAARTDESATSGHVMLGYADPFNGIADLEERANPDVDANFVIYDNVLVESVTQTRPKWNVDANGNWSNSGNWLNGVPNGNEAVADFTDAISGSGKTVTVDSNHTVRSMVFDNAQSYTLAAGGGTIHLDSLTTGILGTIKVKSGSHTIDAPMSTNRIVWVDTAAGTTLNVNGGITATSNTRYLKKTGSGTLVMGGSGLSNYDGGTRVEGGTLRLGANQAIPHATGLTVSPGGTFDLQTFNQTTKRLFAAGGTVAGSTGVLTIEDHIIGSGTATTNITGRIAFDGTKHSELAPGASGPLNISGPISNALKIHQWGTGTTTLSGANTYNAPTAVRSGTLIVAADAPSGAPGALGNSTSAVEVGDSTVTALTNVRVASTGNIGNNVSVTYNGSQLVGSLPGTVDGVALANGDRILVKNQVDGIGPGRVSNGVYVRDNANSWTRVTELDQSSELQYGTQVTITAGTTQTGQKWYLFDGFTLNTDAIVFGREQAASSLLTGGPVNIGRNVNVLTTGNTGTSTLGGATAHSSTFSGAVTLSKDTTLTAATGGTVNFTGALSATGMSLTKTGAGTVVAKNYRAANVTVSAGSLKVATDGTANGVSIVNTLSVNPAAGLDLTDNDLVVNNGAYSTIKALVLAGFGNNPGITSSTSDGSQILALFDNAQVGASDWLGHPIGANAVVGKYTYFGDANIDGQVSGDDYTVIDANLNTTPPVGLEWLSGDMNLDGSITGDDYTVIDANLGLGNGNPLSPSNLTAVPEPGSVGLLAAAGAGALLRRRRAGRNH